MLIFRVLVLSLLFCTSLLAQIPGLKLKNFHLGYPSDTSVVMINGSTIPINLDSIGIKHPGSSAYYLIFHQNSTDTTFDVFLNSFDNRYWVLNLQILPSDSLIFTLEGIDPCIFCKKNGWEFIDTLTIYSSSYSQDFGIRSTEVGVDDDEINVVSELRIIGNYPNPFNPSTKIQIYSKKGGNGFLVLYDMSGRIVINKSPFTLTNGINDLPISMDGFSSGIYFVEISRDGIFDRKPILLVK